MTKSQFKISGHLLLLVYILTVIAPFWMHHHDDLIVSSNVGSQQVKSSSDSSEPTDSQKPVRAHDCYLCVFTHQPIELQNVLPSVEQSKSANYASKNHTAVYLEIIVNSSPERGPPSIS